MSFSRFGIDHLSVSSCNLFKNEPAMWVMKYCLKIQGEKAVAAMRGTAVEQALDTVVLHDASDDDAIQIALNNFTAATEGEISDKIEKEKAAIPDMVRRAAHLYRPHGKPVSHQVKIDYFIDGIDIPIIGFVDYKYPEFLSDLKTTLRMPSEPQPDHIVQVAFYSTVTSLPPFLTYVTPNKAQSYGLTEAQITQGMWTLRRSALALQRLLSRCENVEELTEFLVPKLDHYVWDATTKQRALEIWR